MEIAQDLTKAESNAEFSRQTFGLSDMSIVINLLTRLYSNPIRTLTQEYICNGRDANRESKSKRPIQITVPTRFEPTLSIRDFGPGLSPERIKTVFLLYGASTKRTNNTQTGGFGIGAKSAWAYTDSFTIITYLDGVKRVYIAHKSGGNGNLDLVSESITNEENGTTIEIAVKPQDIEAFKAAVLRATYFWSAKEIPDIKGIVAADMPSKAKTFEINNNAAVHYGLPEFFNGEEKLLVIDGIAYPMASDLREFAYYLDSKLNGFRTITFTLNNGDVNILPNREEIIVDDKSKNLIKSMFFKATTDVTTYITSELNKYSKINDLILKIKDMVAWFRIEHKLNNYVITSSYIEHASNIPLFKAFSRKNGKLRKEEKCTIRFEKLDNLYYSDVVEAESRKTMRIRAEVEKTGKEIILVIADDKQVAIDLNAKPLSTLPVPAIQRQAALPVQKRDFCIHLFTGYKAHPKQVNLTDLKGSYIYIPMSHKFYNDRNDLSVIKEFTHSNICYVADSNLSYVTSNEGKKLFTHIDDFINNFVASDKQINDSLTMPGCCEILARFAKHKDLLVDFKLVDIIAIITAFKGEGKRLPKYLANNAINKDKIEKLNKALADADTLIKTKYNLLNSTDAYNLGKDFALEYVEYMNWKHSMEGK